MYLLHVYTINISLIFLGLPGFEPGLVDSESTVLAITPQALFFVSYLESHDTFP